MIIWSFYSVGLKISRWAKAEQIHDKADTCVHFRSAAPQQVDESSVEGHDGISQMNSVLLMLLFSGKPDQMWHKL